MLQEIKVVTETNWGLDVHLLAKTTSKDLYF